MIHQIVDRLHVSTSNREVIKYVRSRLAPRGRKGLEHKADRKAIYRMALEAHRENRELYRTVMRGI